MSGPAAIFSPESTITVALPATAFANLSSALQNAGREFSVSLVPVGDCTALGPLPPAVQFTGLELLFAIGRACSRPDVLDDPSRLFALFKYCNVISLADEFRLKRDVESVDSHKKKVLSDEFGCGMSFIVGSQCFGANFFLDFSTAVQRGWVATTAPKSRRPDYVTKPSGVSGELTLLEAKGTQTSLQYSQQDQIPSGCNQLESVNLVDSSYSIQKRAVVGIALQGEDEPLATTCHVGDPVSKPGYTFTFSDDVDKCIIKSHYARVASLIGDAELAGAITKLRQTTPVQLVERPTGLRKLSGTSLTLTSTEGAINIFAGIDIDVRQLVIEGADLGLIQSTIAAVRSSLHDSKEVSVDGGDGTFLVVSTGMQGNWSLLETTISPRPTAIKTPVPKA